MEPLKFQLFDRRINNVITWDISHGGVSHAAARIGEGAGSSSATSGDVGSARSVVERCSPADWLRGGFGDALVAGLPPGRRSGTEGQAYAGTPAAAVAPSTAGVVEGAAARRGSSWLPHGVVDHPAHRGGD